MRHRAFFRTLKSVDLTLGVLRTLTRFTQTHFLTLNFTGIASHEASSAQLATQRLVVVHQCTGNAVTDGTGLTGDTAALNSDVNVELFSALGQLQRLTNNHACSFATEEGLDAAVVDGNIASTRTQEHPSGGGFTTASTVVLCHRHSELLLDLEFLGLLSGMRMRCTSIYFHLAVHCPTQWVAGQHALNSKLDDTLRSTLVQSLKIDGFEPTRNTGVAVIQLVLNLVAGHMDFFGIHDHDVIAGIH